MDGYSTPVSPPVHPRALDYPQSILSGPTPQEAELTSGTQIHAGQGYGFFTDTTLCIGCKACEVACKTWNVLPADGMTGVLFKTEFNTVVVQQDICNGCGYCVPSCPFNVVDLNLIDGKAHKCTLCYERLKGGLEPACAKSCPTDAIQFGEVSEVQERARQRVESLQRLGVNESYLYGVPDAPGATGGLGHLNAFFLLIDRPAVYNLPTAPARPANRLPRNVVAGLVTAGAMAAAIALSFIGSSQEASA